MTPSTRIQRPLGTDYLADVRKRFGHLGLVNLAALGTTGTDQRKPYQVSGRVAVIYLTGLLSNDAYWWDETDYRDIQDEVSLAAADAEVDGILLVAASPGGYTDLCFETVDVIAQAAKQKVVWAVANPIAYSACYALVSQASKIYVPKYTGGVGSVGVYCAHFDYSGMLKQMGIDVTLISKGEGKTDGNPYEPLGDRARKDIETEMDRLYGLFVGAVARGRALTEAQVRKLGAYCYEGSQESLGVGLADVAGTAEEALAALNAQLEASKKTFPSAAAAAPANSPKEVSSMNEPNAAADPQQATAAALETARQEGLKAGREAAQAETQEINALCQIAGKPEMAAQFLSDKKTPAQVREALVNARAESGKEGGELRNHTHAGTSAGTAGSMKERMVGRLQQLGRMA